MFLLKSIRLALTTGRGSANRCTINTSCISDFDAREKKIENIVRFKSDLNCTSWTKIGEHKKYRTFSTLQTHNQQNKEFMAVFQDIVKHFIDQNEFSDNPEVLKWYAKVLQYNVPHGDNMRGMAVAIVYKMLEDPANLSAENVRLANILGWCIEMFQGSLLVADDIMDNTTTRRGSPCWYSIPGIGINAVNDAFVLESGLYNILKLYFAEHPCYVPVWELFHNISLRTLMGQTLASFSHVDGKPNLDAFTMKRFNTLAKYKTAYFSFHLPVELALLLAGKFDQQLYKEVDAILLEMGRFVTVQDDFVDCYGNSIEVGTDIQEGKFSWLVVVALQKASRAQEKYYVTIMEDSNQNAFKL